MNAKVLQSPDFGFSVSLTTRAPRPGEVDGVNYRYVTHDYFEKMIADGRVSVDGEVISEMGVQVEIGQDIRVDGKLVYRPVETKKL